MVLLGSGTEITYLTKTSMRAPREAKGDEVVSFSDDIEIIEIPRLGHRRVPRRHGRVNNINIDGNSYMMRGQMMEEPLLRFEAARCGASPQPSVGACTISW